MDFIRSKGRELEDEKMVRTIIEFIGQKNAEKVNIFEDTFTKLLIAVSSSGDKSQVTLEEL